MNPINKKAFILSIPMILLVALFGEWLVIRGQQSVQNAQKQPIVSENPEETQASDAVDISSWKTYRNEQYGFEVKYPEGWIVTVPNKNEYGEVVSLTSGDTNPKLIGAQNQDGDNIVIHFLSSINEEIHLKSLGKKVKNLEEFLSLDANQTEMALIEKIEFHNRPAYVVGKFGLTGHYGIVFESKSGIYEIIFEKTTLSTDQGKLLKNKLEGALPRQEASVLDSFKTTVPDSTLQQSATQSEIESVKDLIDGEYAFTQTDTTSWQTYRNEEMGFEVKIPKNWKLMSTYREDDIGGNYFYFGEKGASYSIPEGGKSDSAVLILSSDRNNAKATPLREYIQKRKASYGEQLFYTLSLNGVDAIMLGNDEVNFFKGNKRWSISFQLYYDGNNNIHNKEHAIFLDMIQTFKFLK